VIEYKASPDVLQRVEYLGDRASEGMLTDEERCEYDAIIDAFDTIALLELRVRRCLSAGS
jgi:hypothetical protein